MLWRMRGPMMRLISLKSRVRPGFILFSLLAIGLFSQVSVMDEYRVGSKDVLQVDVYGVESLTNLEVTVSAMGRITLPLLGEVDVNGLTKSEVEEKLVRLLKDSFLRNPRVTVLIKQYQSRVVYMIGAVLKPGIFPLLGSQNLLEMLVLAGGPTPQAGPEVILIRKQDGKEGMSLRIPLQSLMSNLDSRLDIPLQPGDVVNVPADRNIVVYILGAVKTPGALEVKLSSMPTLLKAITKAGGFTDRANQRDVRVRRVDAQGVEKEVRVNVRDIIRGKKKDMRLEPEDVIIVGESIF